MAITETVARLVGRGRRKEYAVRAQPKPTESGDGSTDILATFSRLRRRQIELTDLIAERLSACSPTPQKHRS